MAYDFSRWLKLDFLFQVRIDDRLQGGLVPISVINGNPLQPISAAETEQYKLWVAEKKLPRLDFHLLSTNKLIKSNAKYTCYFWISENTCYY